MTAVKPYDYTKLDEIVLFKGKKDGDLINLSRDGRYINLIKPTEEDKRYYRYDLKKRKFQRINFYKTTDDKISDVKVKNITGWFKDCRIVTKDLHFGRLIIFAKFNISFSSYSSPVRFIEQLGHKIITSIEQWEALGFRVEEMEDFFGEKLIGSKKDIRKSIYEGEERCNTWGKLLYYRSISLAPGDFSKEVLDYIKRKYEIINSTLLNSLFNEYNHGEYHIEKKLKEIGRDPEFVGVFHYSSQNGYGYNKTIREKWAFGTSSESRRIRANIINAVQEFNLDPVAFCKWLKKQQNVDKNDVGYLFGFGNHYNDYLDCERLLCDGKLSKMNKYPDNFRSQFHRVQEEFAAKKGDIDEAKFERQATKNKELEHIGKKFLITIPKKTIEIDNEALVLGHCVRTYIPRVINGDTLILFLRDKENPDEPLITLEVKKGSLTQAYGAHDSKPKKEHLEFLKMWCNMKKLRVGCWKTDLL